MVLAPWRVPFSSFKLLGLDACQAGAVRIFHPKACSHGILCSFIPLFASRLNSWVTLKVREKRALANLPGYSSYLNELFVGYVYTWAVTFPQCYSSTAQRRGASPSRRGTTQCDLLRRFLGSISPSC